MKPLSLSVAIGLTTILASEAIATGATTLKVGVPGGIGQAPSYESISTTQVDSVLNSLPSYPNNFTRDKANAVFQDLAALKASLSTDLRLAVASLSDVKQVYSLSTVFNPVQARLTQESTSIGLEIGGIDADISMELETQGGFLGSLVCASPDVDVTITGIKGVGSYNAYTGAINGVTVTYGFIESDADCGGLFGFVGDWFFEDNVEDGVIDQINASLNQIDGIANRQTLFSIRDFLEGLLDSNYLTEPYADDALNVMDSLVMQTNLNSGLALDIIVDDNANNTISFLAGHHPPTFTNMGASGNNRSVHVVLPANTAKVDIYRQSTTSSNWALIQTITTNTTITFPHNRLHAKIGAIGESSLISGLKSTVTSGIFFDPTEAGSGGRK